MKKLSLALPLVSALALAAACSNDPADTPASQQGPDAGTSADGGNIDGASGTDSGGTDGGNPVKPTLDPRSGSFAALRTQVDTLARQGREGEFGAADRLITLQDPLFVANAIQEVQRAAATADCQSAQFGCPSPATADALIAEYKSNKTSLTTGLKKVLTAQHGWGRIALASTLLAYLNLLEQSKGLTPAELKDVSDAAKLFGDAVSTQPITPAAGMYPEISPNAPLYQFSFGLIRPAAEVPPATVAAANTFITAVFQKLGVLAIGPKPEDPIVGLAARLKQGLGAQGINVQGILVPGSEAHQVMEALPYFVTVPATAPVDKVDAYIAQVDNLLGKLPGGAIAAADWNAYGAAADALTFAFDAPAGVLIASELAPLPVPVNPLQSVPGDLESDPNVLKRVSTTELLRKSTSNIVGIHPTLNVRTWPALATNDRRVPLDVPFSAVVPALAPRTLQHVGTDLWPAPKDRTLSIVFVGWTVATSSAALDHVDVRIENLTAKKTVFHKVYRTSAVDGTIATSTVIPVTKDWFNAGNNDLQLQVVGVDRMGRSSGIVCGSLNTEVTEAGDSRTAVLRSDTAGKCFTSVDATTVTPLASAPGGVDVAISKLAGSPYRPGSVLKKGTIRIYNDTSSPRRLRSLFTPEYTEFLPIDLTVRKDTPSSALAPMDTGTIAPGNFVDLVYPTGTPDGYAFSLADDTSAARYRLILQSGVAATDPSKYW